MEWDMIFVNRHHEFTNIHNYFILSFDVESIGRANSPRSLAIDHWNTRKTFYHADTGEDEEVRILNSKQKGGRY